MIVTCMQLAEGCLIFWILVALIPFAGALRLVSKDTSVANVSECHHDVSKDPLIGDIISDAFIKDHEWHIHGMTGDPDQAILKNPYVFDISEDIAIEEARTWCKERKECAAFLFQPQSFYSPLTVDLVIYLSKRAQDGSVAEHLVEDIMDLLPESIEDWDEWVVHVLQDRYFDTNEIFEHLERTLNEKSSPYRHCCFAYEEDDEYVRFPTKEELFEAETIERVPCNISRKDFVEKYESKRTAVVLEGCAENWPTQERWNNYQSLAPRFDNNTMWNNCGNFLEPWWEAREDMIPDEGGFLCIFDQIDGSKSDTLLDDYTIPRPFQDADMFENLPRFPPGMGRMAWFSFGEENSASYPHHDYHLPSADQWNTLVHGSKWWVLYPDTELLRSENTVACIKECSDEGEMTLDWFAGVGFHANKFIYEDGKRPLHVLQREGDTVYIPANWMHSLINLEDCIAVTQAYGSVTNLAEVWKQVLVKGDDKDWTRLYYSVFDAEQRKIARDVVMNNEIVCVTTSDVALGKLYERCSKSSFFSRVIQK